MHRNKNQKIPLSLKDIVNLAKEKYEKDKLSTRDIKDWLGGYQPPMFLYEGVNDYYEFMAFLCRECNEPWEAERLAYIQARVNGDHEKENLTTRTLSNRISYYFQVDDDEKILEWLSEICYSSNRIYEYAIIEKVLSQIQVQSRDIHQPIYTNWEYFMEQIEKPGTWILVTDSKQIKMAEFLGNLLGRLRHKVFLIVKTETIQQHDIPSDEDPLNFSLDDRQEYPDITVIYNVCIQNAEGEIRDNTAQIIRSVCRLFSDSDYAHIIAPGRLFDELQGTEIKREMARLSQYQGEIFQNNMVFGRIGNYMSYLECLYQKPMYSLLDRESSFKFSVVIPARNSGKYLQHTIRTCLEQRYREEYEVLISDNSSPGNTQIWELYQSFHDKRLRYIKTPRELGLTRSFEYACLHARGKYFFSIGSDDGIFPWTLQVLDEVTSKHPQESIIKWDIGNYMWPDYNGSKSLRANMVYVPCQYQKEAYDVGWIDLQDILLYALQKPGYMYVLPSSYLNSCYKKSYLKEVLAKSGRLWDGTNQDVYMGITTAALHRKALALCYPMVLAAQSRISMGATSNYIFNTDLRLSKNEFSGAYGRTALSPTERLLPENAMDYAGFYRSILRVISWGGFPIELIKVMDWKTIYRNIAGQYRKDKIVFNELMHNLKYAALNLGNNFAAWFDEEIYGPRMAKTQAQEQKENYTGWEDSVGENGCVALTLTKYGVKNVYDAVKMFGLITEL